MERMGRIGDLDLVRECQVAFSARGISLGYRWKGSIESADEYLLVIKSSRDRMQALMASLEKEHSYEVPEVIALAVVDGAPNYLNWLQASLQD